MKIIKTALKIFLWFIIILLLIILIIYVRPAWTPGIKSENGKKAIASLEKIDLGNCKQTILIRSKDINNPILLFLHGGPGMPMMYLSYKFQRRLEKYFIVVQWDQRGAGNSYDPKIPLETINIEQYISDARQLIDTLCNRFNQKKIFVVGHSWGTYIGSILVSRYPELFYAYVSVGQEVDDQKADQVTRKFLYSEAINNNDTALLTVLNKPGFVSLENWVFKYGGELKHARNIVPLVITGLFSPEYNFKGFVNTTKGPGFCGRNMKYNAINGSISDNIKEYKIPVFFLTGDHDYCTPFELINSYYDSVNAPFKEIIWFKESGHFAFYEEPEKFDSIMINHILPMVITTEQKHLP